MSINTGTDVGRCSRHNERQRWLEETHCPMCCPAREGLRSKVKSTVPIGRLNLPKRGVENQNRKKIMLASNADGMWTKHIQGHKVRDHKV